MTDAKSKNLLIVEDEEDIRFAVSFYLENAGYIVQSAENGAAALALLKKDQLPALILLDSFMPIMDGWHFATQFRETFDPTRKVPLIVMTAATNAEQRGKDIGASASIDKPFKLTDLLALIRKFEL